MLLRTLPQMVRTQWIHLHLTWRQASAESSPTTRRERRANHENVLFRTWLNWINLCCMVHQIKYINASLTQKWGALHHYAASSKTREKEKNKQQAENPIGTIERNIKCKSIDISPFIWSIIHRTFFSVFCRRLLCSILLMQPFNIGHNKNVFSVKMIFQQVVVEYKCESKAHTHRESERETHTFSIYIYKSALCVLKRAVFVCTYVE